MERYIIEGSDTLVIMRYCNDFEEHSYAILKEIGSAGNVKWYEELTLTIF